MKIIKNIFKSLALAVGIIVLGPALVLQLFERIFVFPPIIFASNYILVSIFSIYFSFVFFNSINESTKKKSRNILLGLVIYYITSLYLTTTSFPWERKKVEVAWSNKPLYSASTRDNNLSLFVRWQSDELTGKYKKKLIIGNNSCNKAGNYEMRLKGEQKKRIYSEFFNDNFFEIFEKQFNNVTNWDRYGKKTLLITDPCGYNHRVEAHGYFGLLDLDPSDYK